MRADLSAPEIVMDEAHLVAAGSPDDKSRLCRQVREKHPRARFLARLSQAQRHAWRRTFHDVWLDPGGEELLVLEHSRAARNLSRIAETLALHRVPLRSPACGPLLTGLAVWPIERLDDAATGDTFRRLYVALTALEELYEIHLARLRLTHRSPGDIDQAIRDQIARAGTKQETARRTAFRDWHLRTLCGDREEIAPPDAAKALGYDPDAPPWDLVQALGAWPAYQDKIIDGPRIDPWWTRGRRSIRHYYEFRTLGRELTERQQTQLRKVVWEGTVGADLLTVDLTIDPREGDYRWEPAEVVGEYFDMGLHFSQSGPRDLWIRLPAALADRMQPYELSGVIEITAGSNGDLVVEMIRYEEDGELTYEGTDPTPWLQELLPLRNAIADGDLSQHGTAGSLPLHPWVIFRGSSILEREEPLSEGSRPSWAVSR